MKILHVCLAAFYIDNYSYQENMLPKYHKKLGYDVSILASLQSFDKNGNACYLENENEYINEYGIPVKRIRYKNIFPDLVRKMKIYNNVYNELEKINPDILFIHGCQFSNMRDIKKYAINNPTVRIFVDNHCDFSNSATNWFSKNILHRIFWRYSAKIIEPYATKFYGVLPARVDFLIDMYNIKKNKVELLVMGADDEKVVEANKEENIDMIRKKFNIKKDDFLIVTGGKIDSFKRQTLLLMEAIKRINRKNIKLIVFGSVTEEIKADFANLIDENLIKYSGWIKSEESYNYFAAADLIVFPGRHSVLWEQVVAQGKPMLVKYWTGTDHIKIDSNCEFLYEDSVDEIVSKVENIVNNKEKYDKMKISAQNIASNYFLYSNIAKKSLIE